MNKQTAAQGHGVGHAAVRVKEGLRKLVLAYNRRLSRIYSPKIAALSGTAIVLVIALVLLFFPPYVGVADDGSLDAVMRGTGLGYRTQDLTSPTGAYYVRMYLHTSYEPSGFSSHRLLIRAAMRLDDLFTHDNLFDTRFLAGVYLLLYLPAVFLVLYGLASRVKVAAEATLLAVLGALVLGDGAFIAYFNTLYPEAMWQIFLMYSLGLCMSLQHEGSGWMQFGFPGLAVAGSVLALVETHCAVVALVLALFCLRQLRMESSSHQSFALALTAAVLLIIASVFGMSAGASRFTETSKLHAVTNGALTRSLDPAETLREFGIDPRFETLADSSSYADYPYALSGNPELKREFLSRYSTGSLLLFYMRHPLMYFGLLELGTKAAFSPIRSYVGSYEASLGLPQRARNPLFLFYSGFKNNSLPRSIGFLVLISAVYYVLFSPPRGLQRRKSWSPRERQIMLDSFLCMLMIGIADISAVIVLSGTAELERYQMLYGSCVDSVLLLFVAEILHRLNILSAEE